MLAWTPCTAALTAYRCRRCKAIRRHPILIRHGIKDLERCLVYDTAVADLHNGSYVSASIAIIGRRPHRDEAILRRKRVLEAFLHQLMRSCYERYRVDVIELGAIQRVDSVHVGASPHLLRHLRTEQPACAAR